MLAMLRRSRISLVASAVAVTVAAGVALAGGGGGTPATSTASATTPSGRVVTLTVHRDRRSAPGWCAEIAIAGDRPVEHEHCDRGADPGLDGAFIADCVAGELIAYGAVRRGVTIVQPRRDRRAITATYAPRPAGVRFRGQHYVIAVDLKQRRPRLLARQHGRTMDAANLADEARRCRDGLAVIGWF